jgi:bacteriocin-like protein
MSDKNTDDKELSIDELKNVSGGGMGLDRLGTQKTTSRKKSIEGFEDRVAADVAADYDYNDQCSRPSNVIFPGNEDLD